MKYFYNIIIMLAMLVEFFQIFLQLYYILCEVCEILATFQKNIFLSYELLENTFFSLLNIHAGMNIIWLCYTNNQEILKEVTVKSDGESIYSSLMKKGKHKRKKEKTTQNI